MTETVAERPWTAKVRRTVLSNGLTVLIEADPDAPAVGVVTHVKAGFFDEPDRWVGISHVLEHMFFKGTPTRGVGQIANETKGLGGYLNAGTSYDYTQYYVVLPASGVNRALEIQADALRNSTIDAGELARELQVIIQEAKRKLDTPASLAYEVLHEVMYDRHRMRRWRIGTETMLAGFTRADVDGYYRSRYVPERAIVSVVGAVDVDATLKEIERRYGDWRAPFTPFEPGPTEPPRVGVRTRTIRGDVAQAELILGWPGVPPLHEDAPVFDVLAGVLSSGRGGWLYRLLRETGLVTSVGAYHYAPTELGVFAVAADLGPSSVRPAIAGLAGCLARLREVGPDPVDLERTRRLFRARWARRFETVDGRAAAYAHAEALGGIELLDREYQDTLAVDAAAVQRVARAYLDPNRASAVGYLPLAGGAPIEAAELLELLTRPEPIALAPAAPSEVTVPAPGPLPARRTQAGVAHFALAHGDLLIRPKRGTPLVTVGLYQARAAAEAAGVAGVGALALRSTNRGAAGYGAAELAALFEAMGGTLSTSVNADWFGVGTTVLSEAAVPAAALLRAVLTEPTLAPADVERERQTLFEEVRQVTDDMFRYPVQLGFAQAFRGTRYGLPVSGWPETVERLTADDVRRWYAAELGRSRPVLLLVGDVDPEAVAGRLAPLLERPLGSGAAPVPVVAGADVVPAALAERAKSQSAFAMVFPGPSRRAADRFEASIWAAVASGLGGRLFSALRDQRSLAYTVMASAWQRSQAGALVTYIATSPEREDEARAAMLEELERFRVEPVSEVERVRATNYVAGQIEVQRQSSGAVAAEMLDAWLVGLGLDELEDPSRPYREVTSAQMLAMAQAYLDPTRRVEGVVRGTGGAR